MEPFKFYECTALVRMTGRRASDLIEFAEIIRNVSPASIFHHMHQYFLKPHIRLPEYPNDFAIWAADALEDKILAERLANLNPFEFTNMEDIRSEILRIITEHLKEYPAPRPVIKGKEFFFNEGITLVAETHLTAATLQEFLEALKEVHTSSIYFHFYEARLRLGKALDDFSRFFEDCEEQACKQVACRIRSLDPYMYTTEMLREKIIEIVEARCHGA
ncbi:MAG TPA: hypothetical protein ENK42_05385 [Deltaproteobacteria bacterium]|nr:hypothetical protein [Deltaproteobacteria bacterium]